MPTLIENKTLNDNVTLCKELGLSFIELNMNFPEYQIDKLEKVTDFYKAVDDAGIYISLPDRKVQMYERDFDIYMDYFKIFRESCEMWIGDTDFKIAIENKND